MNIDNMSARQYEKYLWLVNTIHSAGRITFKKIEEKWAYASVNEDKASRLPRSSFNEMKREVELLYRVEIQCDRSTNEYYIANLSNLPTIRGEVSHWGLAQQEDFKVKSPLPIQRIRIHVIEPEAKDTRRFPLHPSQHEIRHDLEQEYAIFDYLMAPTLEFFMKIRSMGSEVELIEPEWLRQHLVDEAELLHRTYVEGVSIQKEAETGRL